MSAFLLPCRSAAAFLMSFKTVWDSARWCYFWTFTGHELPDQEFIESWNRFNRRWGEQRNGEFKGLRVFEPHKSGFLHVHAIINQRWDVTRIRELAVRAGLGRIHVKVAWPESGDYLAKYLRKNMRSLPKSVRVWDKLGRWEHTKIHSLIFESDEAFCIRYAYHVVCAGISNQKQRWCEARAKGLALHLDAVRLGRVKELVEQSRQILRERETHSNDVVARPVVSTRDESLIPASWKLPPDHVWHQSTPVDVEGIGHED